MSCSCLKYTIRAKITSGKKHIKYFHKNTLNRWFSFIIHSFSIIFSRYESLARNLYCRQKFFFSKQFCLWRFTVTLRFIVFSPMCRAHSKQRSSSKTIWPCMQEASATFSPPTNHESSSSFVHGLRSYSISIGTIVTTTHWCTPCKTLEALTIGHIPHKNVCSVYF